jgi:predicted NBD/HSP70 family sugar kinase
VGIVADRIASCVALLMDGAGRGRTGGRSRSRGQSPDVVGVGIGVPGAVERGADGAALVHAQAYGWDAVPLERLLVDRLRRDHGLSPGTAFPLLFDNGAKAMGQAELWFGAGRGTRRAAVCLIGSGVGASVIADGASTAAEWGHTTLVADGRLCRCGSRGCLEAYVGAEAILARYGPPPPGGDEESALAALVTATSGRAIELLDETAVFLGIGIANLINLINPDRVILGGWVGQLLCERMMPAIHAAAQRHSLRHAFAGTSIERGELGPDAVALGAATLPIERFLNGTASAAPPPPAAPASSP